MNGGVDDDGLLSTDLSIPSSDGRGNELLYIFDLDTRIIAFA